MENAGIGLTALTMIYMNLCTCINRLRDSGRSRFWYCTFLLPSVGTALMIYFCGIEKGPGKFISDQPDPKDSLRAPAAPPAAPSRMRTSAPAPREFGRRNRPVD